MARTALVRDVLWRISDLLQDLAPQYNRWPEQRLVNLLDDAQMAICKFLPLAGSRVDAIKLKPGTLQSIETIVATDCKPGDGSTPMQPIMGMQFIRLLNNMGADGLTPGKVIRMASRDLLDAMSPDWHTETGSSVESFMFDPDAPRYFMVTPGVTGTLWARAVYVAQPLKLPNTGAPGAELYKFDGASNLVIGVPDEFVDDLVNYVCARSFMRNSQNAGDPAKATAYTSAFLSSLNAKVTAVTGNNPNLKVLPFAPNPIGQAGS